MLPTAFILIGNNNEQWLCRAQGWGYELISDMWNGFMKSSHSVSVHFHTWSAPYRSVRIVDSESFKLH